MTLPTPEAAFEARILAEAGLSDRDLIQAINVHVASSLSYAEACDWTRWCQIVGQDPATFSPLEAERFRSFLQKEREAIRAEWQERTAFERARRRLVETVGREVRRVLRRWFQRGERGR